MRINLLIIFFALSLLHSTAQIKCGTQISESDIAFQSGEELSYNVKYSSAIFTTSVADVYFSTWIESNTYRVSALGKTRPFYNVFFEIEDHYNTWLDKQTLRPVRTTSRIKEGGYQYRTEFNYSWSNMTVNTLGQNIKRGTTYTKKLSLINCSFDALALFYNLRCVNLNNMEIGKKYKLDLVLEDTIRTAEYRLIGRESIKIADLGRFNTLKFACTIATESGDALKDGSEFFIWLSDDKNRIPIYMESPIRVGSIKVYLSSWANLKHSFSSVITE